MKKSQLLVAASITALSASSAFAQTQVAAADTSTVETVVVTGSLITRQGYTAPTPVQTLTAEDLLKQSATELSDALDQLPQFGIGSSPTNGWQGAGANQAAASVNLRNLGVSRTLVLVNGERVVPYSTVNTVDLNTLPNAIVKRVDVVTGGASAAYGSDAVAGVVNLILDDDFVGFKASAQYGNTTNLDYETYKAEATYGTTFDGDRVHVLASVSYTDSPQLLVAKQMDWYTSNGGSSAIVSNPNYTATNGQPFLIHAHGVGLVKATQGGVITSGALKNTQFVGPDGTPEVFNPGTVDSQGILSYGGSAETFAQDNVNLGEPSLVYNGYGYIGYDVTPTVKAHIEVDYGHSGGYDTNYPDVHLGTVTVQADNAFLPASVKSALQAAGQTSFSLGTTYENLGLPQLNSTQFVANRNMERVAAGVDGSFGDNWTWTAHYGHGEVHLEQLYPNNPYGAFETLAGDAVVAPAGNAAGVPAGTIVCRSTLTSPTNGCVPIDLFGVHYITPAQKAYIEPYNYYRVVNKQDDAQLSIQGEPISDWAGPISIAGGADYRSASANGTSDALSHTRGFYTGNNQPFHGAQNVYEAFAETIVPLVKNEPWSQSIDFNAAGRLTDYSTSGLVETWKLGLTDQISDEYRLRGTWSFDIRAPNLSELYTSAAVAARSQFDPLTNTTPSIQFVTTGNPNLKPEIGTTFSGGIVLTPDWLPGLSASFDWYSINIKSAIATISNALTLCDQGQTFYCSLVIRQGPLINGINAVSTVYQYPLNTAQATNSGLDMEVDYSTDFWEGTLGLHAAGNYTDETTSVVNGVVLDNAGSLGNDTLGGGEPKFKGLLTATYNWGPFSQTIQTRIIGAALIDAAYPKGYIDNNNVPAVAYLDLRGSYDLGYLKSTQIYYAIDNVLDTPPPSVPTIDTSSGAPYTDPTRPAIYDTLGRVFRIGIRANFF